MKISVLLITYNHSKFIEKALESILMQELNYEFEIVVSDDCSTDDTLKKIKRYKNENFNKIKILQNKENVGITKNYQRGFQNCSGQYIAVLEGDDYWTDKRKLQKHIDFLDNHLECSMSFNRFLVHEEKENKFFIQPFEIIKNYSYLTVQDLARDNYIGNFSTCVYRKKCIEKIPLKAYEMIAYDWLINMLVARQGLVGYLGEVMSVYRLHTNGVWSQASEENKINKILDIIEVYDEFFDYNYKAEFSLHKERLITSKASLNNVNTTLDTKNYKFYLKQILPPILIKILKNSVRRTKCL